LIKLNHNIQIPNNKQYPNTNVQNLKRIAEQLFVIWCLIFVICLSFGACDFKISASFWGVMGQTGDILVQYHIASF